MYASTGQAAQSIGVSRGTLARWWADGTVTPALTTAGGHGRWDVESLKAQLERIRLRPECEPWGCHLVDYRNHFCPGFRHAA